MSADEMSPKGDGGRALDAPPKKTSRRPGLAALQEAIFANAGIVSGVADALRVDLRTVRRWRDGDQRVQAMFYEAKEAVLDLAESEVVKGIRKGIPSDRYFFLKCHGKRRGWVERGEVTGAEGRSPFDPTVEARKMSDAIREAMKDPEYRKRVADLREFIDAKAESVLLSQQEAVRSLKTDS